MNMMLLGFCLYVPLCAVPLLFTLSNLCLDQEQELDFSYDIVHITCSFIVDATQEESFVAVSIHTGTASA